MSISLPSPSALRQARKARRSALRLRWMEVAHHCAEKMKRATRGRLFLCMLALCVLGTLGWALVELFVTDLPSSSWLIVVSLLCMTAYAYLLTAINGHWSDEQQRLMMEPILLLLVVAVFILTAGACVAVVFFGESIRAAFLNIWIIAALIFITTTLLALVENH